MLNLAACPEDPPSMEDAKDQTSDEMCKTTPHWYMYIYRKALYRQWQESVLRGKTILTYNANADVMKNSPDPKLLSIYYSWEKPHPHHKVIKINNLRNSRQSLGIFWLKRHKILHLDIPHGSLAIMRKVL